MADSSSDAAAGSKPRPSSTPSSSKPPPPAPPGNPALRMLGLPNLPRKLPSRNWLIFWAVTGAFTATIVYDKREKKRATAKWRRLVEPLAREPLPAASQLPRKLTIFLEAPPGDGLRVSQDHFIEYVKPILAASGLDWDFVQGRQQGDVRAALAERIRRLRMAQERPNEKLPQTDESVVEDLRNRIGVREYQGVKGDIVVGRHTWKEYVRGLHEGWLGPLDPPPEPERHGELQIGHSAAAATAGASSGTDTELEEDRNKEEKQGIEDKQDAKETKPSRPAQPRPYNSPVDYDAASIPGYMPDELSPSAPIPFPHRLGFTQTVVRVGRFLNRRKLADEIGREVAAACLATSRQWHETDGLLEQQVVLKQGEKDWPKSIWQASEAPASHSDATPHPVEPPQDTTWTCPMVLDRRIASRMRRFEMLPEDEARAAAIVVPEEDVEGWIKGNLRSLWRWGVASFENKPTTPNVGDLEND